MADLSPKVQRLHYKALALHRQHGPGKGFVKGPAVAHAVDSGAALVDEFDGDGIDAAKGDGSRAAHAQGPAKQILLLLLLLPLLLMLMLMQRQGQGQRVRAQGVREQQRLHDMGVRGAPQDAVQADLEAGAGAGAGGAGGKRQQEATLILLLLLLVLLLLMMMVLLLVLLLEEGASSQQLQRRLLRRTRHVAPEHEEIVRVHRHRLGCCI